MNWKKVVCGVLLVLMLSGSVFAEWSDGDKSQNIFEGVETQDSEKVYIDPILESEFHTGISIQTRETVKVIVNFGSYEEAEDREDMQAEASKSQEPIMNLADNNPEIEVKNQFWIANAVLLEIENDFPLEKIAQVGGVEEIQENAEVSTLETNELGSQSSSASKTYGLNQINTSEVWEEFDTKGEGVKVAVLDTGIDSGHQDLELYTEEDSDPTYPGGWAEFDNGEVDDSEPYDCGTHGTHVSGTVAGGNESGESIGVAPNTKLLHAGVLMQEEDGECTGDHSDILDGMEWAVENNADIISMSLGVEGYWGSAIDAVRGAEEEGVLVIAASGNNGEGTSFAPANVYESFAIGAADSEDDIASFSSGEKVEDSNWQGTPPEDWPDQYIVPDVVAPGVGVKSSVPNDNYDYFEGTSMAAPHVSGAAALIQSATSTYLDPDELKESFIETARKPSDWNEEDAEDEIDGQDTRYGEGVIDAHSAVEYAFENFEKPRFEISELEINPEEIIEGDSVNVTGIVNNTGSEDKADLRLEVNQAEVAQKDVKTVFEDAEEFYFEEQFDEPGSYNISVNGTKSGNLNVLKAPELEINEFNLSESEILENESTQATLNAENIGEAEGVFNVNLSVGGTVVQNSSLVLEEGEKDTVEFEEGFDKWGSYNISSNQKYETLQVLKPGSIEFLNSSVGQREIGKGDQAEFFIEAKNPGNVSVEDNFHFKINDSLEDQKNVEIENNSREEFRFSSKELEEKGRYDLSVNGSKSQVIDVLKPGELQNNEIFLSSEEVVAGEKANITSTVENIGEVTDEFDVDLLLDRNGENLANESKKVEVDAGEEKNVTFEKAIEEPGKYTAESLKKSKNFTVLKDADLGVKQASTNASKIFTGQYLELEALVGNEGEVAGKDVFNFTVGNDSVLNKSEELDPGENMTVSQKLQLEDKGNFTAAINDTSAGEIEVSRPFVNITSAEADFSDSGLIEIDASLNNTDPASTTTILEPMFYDVEQPEYEWTAEESFNLNPEEEKDVSIEYYWNITGEYEHFLNSTELGSFELEPLAEFREIRPETETFEEGEEIEFSGYVDIVGSLIEEDTQEVIVEVEGEEVYSDEELWAGRNEFEFADSFDAGEYSWKIISNVHNSTFESSEQFFDIEEVEEQDSDSENGEVPPDMFDEDPELQTSVEEDGAEAYNIYASEDETVKLNFSGGPSIDFVEITADEELENSNFSLSSATTNTDYLLESVYNLQTDAEASFRLEFAASKDWVEEHEFESSEISLHNLDSGEDLEASPIGESADKYYYEAFTEEFSTLGIGVDRSCHSMDSINASDGEECQTFDNVCEVPEDWEEVSTCDKSEDRDSESDVLEHFERLKEEDPESEELEQANYSIEQGDFDQAANVLEQMEEDRDSGVSPLYVVGAVIALGFASVALLMGHRYYARKKLVSDLEELTEVVSNLSHTEKHLRAAERVREANEAAMQGEWDKARKKTFKVKKLLK